MPAVSWYLLQLSAVPDVLSYVLEHSGLPGPRANLELIYAVAAWGDEALFLCWLDSLPEGDDANEPAIFPALCAIVGLGRLLGEGSDAHWGPLRALASDPRWRVREAVAMALQQAGLERFDALIQHTLSWRCGNALEQRALVSGMCEPALLKVPEHVRETLAMLDQVTQSLLERANRKSDDVRVLRQALGYAWSVAVAPLPEEGWPMLMRWADSSDGDVRWIVRENLRKKRLQRLDPEGTATLLQRLKD